MFKRLAISILLSTMTIGALAGGCGGAKNDGPVTAAAPATDDEVGAALAARRSDMLARLHAYRLAAVYPTDAHGMPLAVFRDDKGVRCPMSELIYQSGRADLVDHVVATNNHLRLADVTEGPLLAWMEESGLTREEIIEIQGAMEMDRYQFLNEDGQLQLQLANGSVTNKIIVIEEKLAGQNGASVQLAAKRLTPEQRAKLTVPGQVHVAQH
jgi:hypothetical protein